MFPISDFWITKLLVHLGKFHFHLMLWHISRTAELARYWSEFYIRMKSSRHRYPGDEIRWKAHWARRVSFQRARPNLLRRARFSFPALPPASLVHAKSFPPQSYTHASFHAGCCLWASCSTLPRPPPAAPPAAALPQPGFPFPIEGFWSRTGSSGVVHSPREQSANMW
jgi:hypothetical protein